MVLTIWYWLIRLFRSPHFVLLIQDGRVKSKAGIIKIGFINECLDVLGRNAVNEACIYTVKNQYGEQILHIAGTNRREVVQQLRNVWTFY